jgi:hypothetical protein
MKNQTREKFFKCNCSAHAIQVLKFSNEEETYVSIWAAANHGKPGVWDRLAQCWKILRDGTPYGDEVVLSKQESFELSVYLREIHSSKKS